MKFNLKIVQERVAFFIKSAPLLILVVVVGGLSFWIAAKVPAPLVHHLIKQDYESQAELWKRRVLAQLDQGVGTFSSRSLTAQEVSKLKVLPEASDAYRFQLLDEHGYMFWSTRKADIGRQITKPFYSEIVAAGDIYATHSLRPAQEVDGLSKHSVDTTVHMEHLIYQIYVPIANNGVFVGAIQFYTDATTLYTLTLRRFEVAFNIVAAMMTLMITVTAGILLKTSRHQLRLAQRKSDEERALLEQQMHLAREVQLLGDLNEWLQSSQSLDELFGMVARFMSHLLPDAEGSIYVYSNSRDVLDGCIAWNDGNVKPHIHPESCWGLRRGRTYEFGRQEVNFCCEHAEPHDGRPYFCFPILAHGETVGLMHLRRRENARDREFYKCKKLAQMCAEQISMAIANVRMRDQLQEQSTRDPLTSLFNRRYMLDRLRRLIGAANVKKEKIHLLYVDVDHFKKFNDSHGHDAGDIVLRKVGETLQNACDGDDIACRMGGEEFMLILPSIDDETAFKRAEDLRKSIESLSVAYQEKHLPTITISAGIACFPDDERDIQALLRLADEALYRAKDGGRNQIVRYSQPKPAPQSKPPSNKTSQKSTPKLQDPPMAAE